LINFRLVKGESDNPYSLMLGMAGEIIAQIDFLKEENSAFPGYEV